MTAKESLTHEWFTNDVHRTDFEELYRRSIRHWRPCAPKEPAIELIQADSLQSLSFRQGISPSNQKRHRRGPQPVDPPYKPFPRRLHSQVFFPKRKISSINNTMPDDVKAAIQSKWNSNKSRSIRTSVEEDDLPTPHAFDVGKGSDNSATAELQEHYLLAPPTSLQCQPKEPRPQPLRSKLLLTSTDPIKNNGCEAQARKVESYYANSEGEDSAPVQKAYSPTAWRSDVEATNSTLNSKAKVMLPNSSVHPRSLKALSDSESNSRIDLPYPLGRDARILHSSRYFAKQSSFEQMKLDQPVMCTDEEGCLTEGYILCQASSSPTSNGQKRADHLTQGFIKPALDTMVLISEPKTNAECSRSSRGAPGAFFNSGDATNNVVRPESAFTGLRMRSPARAVSNVSGIRSSNMKKRRSQSIFDFEEDSSGSLPGQSKKAKAEPENVKRQNKQTSINMVFPQTKANLEDARSTSMKAEKILGQTNHTEPLYLPRV